MNSKQLIITTLATTLMAFSYTVAAECEDEGHLVKAVYMTQASNDHHAVRVNDKNQGKHNRGNDNNRSDKGRSTDGSVWYNPWSWQSDSHDNQNSNRQSDPDSTRGQARAEERRGDRGDKDNPKNDKPWYNPRGWFE